MITSFSDYQAWFDNISGNTEGLEMSMPDIKKIQRDNEDFDFSDFFTDDRQEPYFKVDLNKRLIDVPQEFEYAGVEGDVKAETLYFVVNRFFDNADLRNGYLQTSIKKVNFGLDENGILFEEDIPLTGMDATEDTLLDENPLEVDENGELAQIKDIYALGGHDDILVLNTERKHIAIAVQYVGPTGEKGFDIIPSIYTGKFNGDDDVIVIPWTLPASVTSHSGRVAFALRFFAINFKNNEGKFISYSKYKSGVEEAYPVVTYALNTRPSAFNIYSGINIGMDVVDPDVVDKTASNIEVAGQMLLDLLKGSVWAPAVDDDSLTWELEDDDTIVFENQTPITFQLDYETNIVNKPKLKTDSDGNVVIDASGLALDFASKKELKEVSDKVDALEEKLNEEAPDIDRQDIEKLSAFVGYNEENLKILEEAARKAGYENVEEYNLFTYLGQLKSIFKEWIIPKIETYESEPSSKIISEKKLIKIDLSTLFTILSSDASEELRSKLLASNHSVKFINLEELNKKSKEIAEEEVEELIKKYEIVNNPSNEGQFKDLSLELKTQAGWTSYSSIISNENNMELIRTAFTNNPYIRFNLIGDFDKNTLKTVDNEHIYKVVYVSSADKLDENSNSDYMYLQKVTLEPVFMAQKATFVEYIQAVDEKIGNIPLDEDDNERTAVQYIDDKASEILDYVKNNVGNLTDEDGESISVIDYIDKKLADATDTRVDVLIGEDSDKSVREIAADEFTSSIESFENRLEALEEGKLNEPDSLYYYASENELSSFEENQILKVGNSNYLLSVNADENEFIFIHIPNKYKSIIKINGLVGGFDISSEDSYNVYKSYYKNLGETNIEVILKE